MLEPQALEAKAFRLLLEVMGEDATLKPFDDQPERTIRVVLVDMSELQNAGEFELVQTDAKIECLAVELEGHYRDAQIEIGSTLYNFGTDYQSVGIEASISLNRAS